LKPELCLYIATLTLQHKFTLQHLRELTHEHWIITF
jgi:hypothetical protein